MEKPVPQRVRIGRRDYVPGMNGGVHALLTAASWIIQRLPGEVVEEQRAELIRTLAEAGDGLVVEVHCGPAVILIRDGDRALCKIPAARRGAGGSFEPPTPPQAAGAPAQ
jgi:hypothetical protein